MTSSTCISPTVRFQEPPTSITIRISGRMKRLPSSITIPGFLITIPGRDTVRIITPITPDGIIRIAIRIIELRSEGIATAAIIPLWRSVLGDGPGDGIGLPIVFIGPIFIIPGMENREAMNRDALARISPHVIPNPESRVGRMVDLAFIGNRRIYAHPA